MTKQFKVGDRVRVSTGRFGPNQHGLIGTVSRIEDRGDMPVWVTYDPSEKSARSLPRENNCYDHSDLEPYGEPAKVAVALKPGDRVVCTDFENSRDRLKGKLGTVLLANSDSTLVKWAGLTTGHGDGNDCWYVPPSFLVLVNVTSSKASEASPAGLVIEEGKNYRLRNGALVGPISPVDNEPFVWSAPQDISDDYVSEWTADGLLDPEDEQDNGDRFDIVAEWIGDIPEIETDDLVINVCDDGCDLTIGAEYRVTGISCGDIDFVDDVGDERTRYPCRYRLAGQPLDQPEHAQATQSSEPEAPPEFAAGDLIRSVSDASDDIAPGDTFTATGIEEDPAGWLVSFTHPISGERSRYAARYEKVAA